MSNSKNKRFGWLLLLDGQLPRQRQDELDALKQEYGVTSSEEGDPFNIQVSSWAGPTSPLTETELQQLELTAFAAYLYEWKPKQQFMESSRAGLARTLKAIVEKEPKRLVAGLNLFYDLPPVYAHAFISGFDAALRQKIVFDWQAVIKYCHHIVNLWTTADVDIPGFDMEPSLDWVVGEITYLLQQGMNNLEIQIPLALRQGIWEVLLPVTQAKEPTPEYEENYGGNNFSPYEVTLNTTRGKAISAVFAYALWVKRRTLAEGQNGKETLDLMPEVFEVLDWHLVLTNDPSPAIHSLYGLYFPQLAWLDEIWAKRKREIIFFSESALFHYHEVAWETYIIHYNPDSQILALLQSEYSAAIERIQPPGQSYRYADPHLALLNHLCAFYCSTSIPFDTSNAMLSRFAELASDQQISQALVVFGTWLQDKTIPEEEALFISERIQEYWKKRLKIIQLRGEYRQHRHELAEFERLFISNRFDIEWALQNLLDVYKLLDEIDAGEPLLPVFEDHFAEHPQLVLECLEQLMLKTSRWHMDLWARSVNDLLRKAVENELTKQLAIILINKIISHGHTELRFLLENNTSI